MIAWERAAGEPSGWEPGATGTGDEVEWFFRARVEAPQDATLVFDGLATYATVSVDGVEAATSSSMWLPVRVPLAPGAHEVLVHCRALAPLLAERRKPRARWRAAVCDNALRFHRTTLLGRAPGFAPGPPVVGLWRAARLVAGRDPLDGVTLLPRIVDGVGVLEVRSPADVAVSVVETGGLRVPDVETWSPWTHGTPRLYDVTVRAGGAEAVRRVGFRTLETTGDALSDGLAVRIDGVDVFVRGAVWTPVPEGEERATLLALRSLGFNAVRVVGTGAYESPAFHDLCDELGLLVWQDLMFANLDHPFSDAAFRAGCREEVAHQLGVVVGRPSLAVVCGSSETEQQVAMLGRDPALARDPFFSEDVPELLAAAGAAVAYLPSAPSGVGRPFKPDEGVANWFGVGGYRRPLTDTRRAGVRFASECLAFSHLPDGDGTGFVPGDAGEDWDFADVRDFYAHELYGEAGTRQDVQRLATGEAMAEVFGEWRRPGSPCRGGFVLWGRDRDAGAGWGVLDVAGRVKPAGGPLARALAPVACWTTDEGQSGLAVHVVNDGPEPVAGVLRVTVYRDGEHVVEEALTDVTVPAHGSFSADVEELLGRWLDASYTYRFGPPQHDLVVVAFGDAVHARFPVDRAAATTRRSAQELGLTAARRPGGVVLGARRVVHGVRLSGSAPAPVDDGVLVEPGHDRVVACDDGDEVTVTALNLAGELRA